MDRLVALEPSNVLPILLEPGQKCSGKFTLRNVMCTMPVAFRLQPMNKARYTIKPQSAIISPLSALTIEVIYHLPMGATLPDSIPYSEDPFLLHSVVVPGAAMRDPKPMFDSVPSDWFTAKKKQVFIDSSIRIMFVGSPVLVKLVSDRSIDDVRKVLECSGHGSANNLADSTDSQGQPLLHIAIARCRADVVELLLEFEPNLQIQSRSGSTPLEAAAAAGEASIVKLLLAHNARTERTESYAWGPIHLAAGNGHLEVLKLLLINGADRNSMTKDGNTALHISVKDRRRDCARLMLASGADPNTRNAIDGDTPLHIAAVLGDEKMVKYLLQRGASKNIQNEAGKTAYDVATELGHTRLFDALKLGDSLCIAARRGEVRSIKKLIENGANISGRDQHGWTALHRACFKGKTEAAKLLIQNGVDVDSKDDEGYTPLHCAVESGHLETVELLVKKGADVNARTSKSITCLQIAESLQYAGICRILVDGGAKKLEGRRQISSPVFVPVKCGKMEKEEEVGSYRVVKRRQPGRGRSVRGSFDRSLPLSVVQAQGMVDAIF